MMQGEIDPYSVPKSMGIFELLESPKNITTTSVAQRIIANHEAYMVSCFPSTDVFLKFERLGSLLVCQPFRCRNAMPRRPRARRNTMPKRNMCRVTNHRYEEVFHGIASS